MHKIILMIVVAMFIMVADVFAGTHKTSPIYASSKRTTKLAAKNRNKVSHKKSYSKCINKLKSSAKIKNDKNVVVIVEKVGIVQPVVFPKKPHCINSSKDKKVQQEPLSKQSFCNLIFKPADVSVDIGHPYLGVIAGTSSAKIGIQQLDTTAVIANGYMQYLPNNKYSTAALYGINGGYELKLNSGMLISLGLGIYQSTGTAKGEVWYIYEKNHSYDERMYNYDYRVQSTRFMLET